MSALHQEQNLGPWLGFPCVSSVSSHVVELQSGMVKDLYVKEESKTTVWKVSEAWRLAKGQGGLGGGQHLA